MRLAILSDTSQPTYDGGHGLGKSVHSLATGLRQRGHDVTLFATEGSQFAGTLVMPTPPDYQAEGKLAAACVEAYRTQPFDAIYDHSHTHVLSKLFPGLPVANHHHDRWQQPRGNAVLCSEGQRMLMGAAFESAKIIHNALPADAFMPSYRPDCYALFVGVFRDYKQPLLAIQAATVADVELKLAGTAPGVDWLQGNRLEYVGQVDTTRMKELYRGASVYLQLGNQEAGPLSNIEAGLSGTPTVAWPAGGNLDYIEDEVNGVFIDTSHPDILMAITDAIDRAKAIPRKLVREKTAAYWGNMGRRLDATEAMLTNVAGGARW